MNLLSKIERTRFLGREFLTWLWFQSDTTEGRVSTEGDGVEVWFDGKLTMESVGDIREQSVIKSENPIETAEAKEALKSGKTPIEARIRVICGQKQWLTLVKSDQLQFSGMKLPALLVEDEEQAIYERLYLMEELEGIIEHLYGRFAENRLDDEKWRSTLADIRHWIQNF
jgi:hypothetical protein